MGLFGVVHGFEWGGEGGGGGGEGEIFYHDETWHSYTLHKEDPKRYINYVIQFLSSIGISIFLPEIKNILQIVF